MSEIDHVTRGATIHRFIAGLSLISDAIDEASFYNSSGEDAVFGLARELTVDEVNILETLGFWNYNPQYTAPPERKFTHASIGYRGWSEPRRTRT
jgi:hypothetical protein